MTTQTETKVKERGILFKRDMVRALLTQAAKQGLVTHYPWMDGYCPKTQTRRVVKPSRKDAEGTIMVGQVPHNLYGDSHIDYEGMEYPINCPYGRIGDRLWVRETFADLGDYPDPARPNIYYRADFHNEETWKGSWQPSLFMPRKACRLVLEITAVRVERLQDISEDDAYSEGLEAEVFDQTIGTKDYLNEGNWFIGWGDEPFDGIGRKSYQSLWASINGQESWDSNPFVWVIEFKVVEAKL